MSVKVDGIEEVTKYFNSKLSPENTRKALLKAGALVERSAKQKAPNDSGELARNVQFEVDAQGTTCTVFNPLEYAPYIEYGTGELAEKEKTSGYWVFVGESGGTSDKKSGKRYTLEEAKKIVAIMRSKGIEAYYTKGQKPQPFLRPALTENENKIMDLLEGALLDD